MGGDKRARSKERRRRRRVRSSFGQRADDLAAKAAGVAWDLDARRPICVDDGAEGVAGGRGRRGRRARRADCGCLR
jgi:hypothetical protein